jgi:S-DNA-T family DNA segregation ATPase FtsK/SpoIIIE
MAIMGVTSLLPRKTTILPEGGRDFLHRRMMELVGVGVAAAGVALLLALFTYSPGDPSLNHATGSPPHNIVGLPVAYISDLLLQTFGLAIVLVPVALITWGVRMARTHHLGFFGLRLSLLLLALLMMSVACIGLGDVGGAATHAGPGGLVGLALVGRFREIVLTHSSGGSLALIEPVCAALAFIAMAPALGMNRTDLPLIFRILRAPFLWGGWLMRAAVGLWRGKPRPFDEDSDLPAPAIGYAEIPGEIDASQYDPARFESRLEQIPEEGAPLPARDSLMVDAPYAPIERPTDDIPEAPSWSKVPLQGPLQPLASPAMAADSVRDRTLFDRLAGLRIEPILGRLRPVSAAPPAAPPVPAMPVDPEPAEAADDNPFTPDGLGVEPLPAGVATGGKIGPRK